MHAGVNIDTRPSCCDCCLFFMDGVLVISGVGPVSCSWLVRLFLRTTFSVVPFLSDEAVSDALSEAFGSSIRTS